MFLRGFRAVIVTSTMVLASGLAGSGAQPPAPAPAAAARIARDVTLKVGEVWTATDLDIKPGERAVFTATGTGQCAGLDSEFGPAGMPRSFRDLLRVLPLQAGLGALIGRIGEAGVAQPFVIGSSVEIVATSSGALALGTNRSENDGCTAPFSVHVEVFPPGAGATTIAARRVDAIDGIDAAFVASLPRRVHDRSGNPGDPVNFVILGSEAGMQRAFKAAGWVTVDADIVNAAINGVLGSLSKEAYLTMPMSQLYLFDRPQDYGWAHAEPIKVVASRHHLRVWRAPRPVAGAALWAGAATHDVGFERDQRTNGVTHQIDPDVDLEREYIEKTLTMTGMVSELMYVLPKDAVREAKTASGGAFHSDGRVLVLKLSDPSGVPGQAR